MHVIQKFFGQVHIVSYNLDQKKNSKSKIHILTNYEQTDLKTTIVKGWNWQGTKVKVLGIGLEPYKCKMIN